MPQLTDEDFKLIYTYGIEESALQEIIMQAKKNYVQEKHPHAIIQLEKGTKKGMWKTYIGTGKEREAVTRKEEKDIYEYLYTYYKNADDRIKTLQDVFNMLKEHKINALARSIKTTAEDTRIFNLLPEAIRTRQISLISEEDIRKTIVNLFNDKTKTIETLKKLYNVLKQTFCLALLKGYCTENPMLLIVKADYKKLCKPKQKKAEEQQFSEEQLEKIREYCWNDKKNPRALMTLLSDATGMRQAELSAILKEDVEKDYFHVHRQQIKSEKDGHEYFYDVEYTKDEIFNPHDGRRIPITEEARKVLNEIKNLEGQSEYLFHDKTGKEIRKDSHGQYLRRITAKLNIPISNNHAIRKAFNARLIEKGLSSSDRALVMGHEVQTNEEHYSLTDSRRLDEIRKRLLNE